MELMQWHSCHREDRLTGRYIIPADIVPLLEEHTDMGELSVIGHSVDGRPVYLYCIGSGSKKVLMWSQMHGNESTTTKAVMDLLLFFRHGGETAGEILKHCTLYIIPMLNPDGALAYTRVNANEIDLNRDAANLSQPESFALRHTFDRIKPHFCFNLHDQRTIFNTGKTASPATLSFLSPATDEERNITPPRKKSMEIIAAINEVLQQYIPGQVGRYDDTFNINCVGDAFQTRGVPTLLFEAGHYPGDYDRDTTRKYVFCALIAALRFISGNDVEGKGYNAYFDIPENDKLFFDILIRRFPVKTGEGIVLKDIGILYKEELKDNKIVFTPYISETGDLEGFYGHREFVADGKKVIPIEEKKIETSVLLKLFL